MVQTEDRKGKARTLSPHMPRSCFYWNFRIGHRGSYETRGSSDRRRKMGESGKTDLLLLREGNGMERSGDGV